MSEEKIQYGSPDAMFEGLDTREEEYVFDPKTSTYFFKNDAGRWVGRNHRMFESLLKMKGLNPQRQDDEKQSEVELKILDVCMNHYVDYAGPLAGWKKGVYELEGTRFLVTRSPTLMDPVPGEWETIRQLMANLFTIDEDGKVFKPYQVDYVYGWWRHALQCLYDCCPAVGLAMVFAGEAGCGKTLCKELIRMSFGGREVYPYNYMVGRDNFNAEMIEAELWTIDDEAADTSSLARAKFGAEIKKAVANSALRFRAMQREAVTLNPFRRLLICVNREPDRLLVLPPLDDDISGKISLISCFKHEMPMPVGSVEEKRAFWNQLKKELPCFLHFLLHEWEMPEELQGRFGVSEFHHPDIAGELFTLSAEAILLGQIDRALFGGGNKMPWKGTTADLHAVLTSDDSPLTKDEIRRVKAANWLGKQLMKLQRNEPTRFRRVRLRDENRWIITAAGQDVYEVEA